MERKTVTPFRIHTTSNIEALFTDRGGDVLVVTFNEMGMKANGRDYWAASALEKLGLSAVGFVSTKPNWFPSRDMWECAERLNEIIGDRFRIRIAYGMSQGGYASIKYARLLGCRLSMCFSPQYSLDAQDISDDRFSRYFDPEVHAEMAISAADRFGQSYVFYDPYVEIDAAHVNCIELAMPIDRIPVCGVGHASSRAFASSETLRLMIEACLTANLAALRALSAQARHNEANRPFQLAYYLAHRRPKTSLAIWKKYRSADGQNWFHVCFKLSQVGHAADVYPWMVEFVDRHPDKPHLRSTLEVVADKVSSPK